MYRKTRPEIAGAPAARVANGLAAQAQSRPMSARITTPAPPPHTRVEDLVALVTVEPLRVLWPVIDALALNQVQAINHRPGRYMAA